MSSLPPLSEVIPLFLVLLFSLSFHEAAHAWTADRLGDPTARELGRITLNPLAHIDWIGTVLFPLIAMMSNVPLLGWAKPVPVTWQNLRNPRRDFAIVALAGPISNLILAVGFALVFMVVRQSAVSFELRNLILTALSLNVLLAVFNMIPVPPLDGGNVLIGFAPMGVARLVAQLRPYGFLILYALLLTGVLSDIIRPINTAILNWLL